MTVCIIINICLKSHAYIHIKLFFRILFYFFFFGFTSDNYGNKDYFLLKLNIVLL